MRRILFKGSGINRKTMQPIKFRVPDTISKAGLEKLLRNISSMCIKTADGEIPPYDHKASDLSLSQLIDRFSLFKTNGAIIPKPFDHGLK